MFSVMNTGRNFRPLCTANVIPTISGKIGNDGSGLNTFYYLFVQRLNLCEEVVVDNGPLIERGIYLYLRLTNDKPIRRLILTCLLTLRGLTPWRHWMTTTGCTSLTTTMWVVNVHGHTANLGALT